jgi:hypothetical protein
VFQIAFSVSSCFSGAVSIFWFDVSDRIFLSHLGFACFIGRWLDLVVEGDGVAAGLVSQG